MNRRRFLGRLLQATVGSLAIGLTSVAPALLPPRKVLPGGGNSITLRKEDWLTLDNEILRLVGPRLQAWANLTANRDFIMPPRRL
jgi:hypothetical protein